MQRRTFVQTLGALGAMAALPRPTWAAGLTRVGLETYSVRDRMRADPDGTLRAIRAMGYDDVELLWSFDNFGRSTAQVKAVLSSTGLQATSAHIAPTLLQGDWNRALDTAAELGHLSLIVPSLPAETDRSLDAWRKWADIFNTAGAAARRHGIWLAFHNEPNHVKPIEGQIPFDLFIARTEARVVRLQLDVGNMLMGGGDPMAYLKTHQARIHSFHVKDVLADRTHDTELGMGTLDVRGFLAAVQDLDRKTVFVEQEGSKDSMASAKRNLDFLRGLRF